MWVCMMLLIEFEYSLRLCGAASASAGAAAAAAAAAAEEAADTAAASTLLWPPFFAMARAPRSRGAGRAARGAGRCARCADEHCHKYGC